MNNTSLSSDKPVFDRAFDNSLAKEGGFVNDPDDTGGATKYGISLRTYRLYYPEANSTTIQNLSVNDAKAFYYTYFWQANCYDEIKNPDLAIKVFDACINMGPRQAHLCLQRALNCVGFKLIEDGRLGQETLKALNHTECPEWSFAILCAFRSELAGYYRLLAATKPKLQKFLNGWIARAYG